MEVPPEDLLLLIGEQAVTLHMQRRTIEALNAEVRRLRPAQPEPVPPPAEGEPA